MDVEGIDGNNVCCRLCSTRGRLMCVLQAERDKNLRDLITRHLNITIRDNDMLPKKVCVDCREKIVTFNDYFEECSKVQDMFMQCWPHVDNASNYCVKRECEIVAFLTEEIDLKDEIKREIPDLQCNSPEINNHGDIIYPDSDSSMVPLLTISNKRKNKKTCKSKFKEERFIKLEDKEVCDVAGDYIKEDSNEVNYDLNPDSISASKSARKRKSNANIEKTTRHKRCPRKIKEIMNFRCSICKVNCLSWYRLQSHCQRKHNSQPIVHCLLCNAAIYSKSTMYKHALDHQKPSAFACPVCPTITKSVIAFENHKMRHIPKAEREYKCEKCSKILKTNDSLKSHHLTHLPIEERKRHPCAVCNLKFTSRSAAVMHKRVVHDKIKPYVCDLCGYACATVHEIHQHRAIHSEEKRFICNVCSKSFKTDSVLRRHMDTHSNTSYMCTICNKVLNTKRTFRKHLLVHDTERKHVCSYCKVAFKRRSTLMVHINSHTGDKPISCRWCSERFMYATSYRTHKQRQHPDKLMQAGPAVTCQPTIKEHESGVEFHNPSNIAELRQ